MLNVSEQYLKQIQADDRQFMLKAEFCQADSTDGTDIVKAVVTGADSLVSVTVEESASAGDAITMGTFCSSKLTMELINAPSSLDYDQMYVKAYSGLLIGEEYEYVPLGVFYITEAETSNGYKNLTIHGYDGACRLEDECVLDRDFPMSIGEFVEAAAEKKNLKLHPDNQYKDYVLPQAFSGYTYRQMLGFAAGLMGCNARFDRENRLQFTWYDPADIKLSAEKKQQYLGEFIPKTQGTLRVASVSCTAGENHYYRGQGSRGITLVMENPYMTETILEEIWQEKIADMTKAEELAVLPVTYTAAVSEDEAFTAVYNQSMETLTAADLTGIYPGSLLMMSLELEEETRTERILVTEIDEEKGEFTFSGEETGEENAVFLTDGQSVLLKPEHQWTFTEEAENLIQAGDFLRSSEGKSVIVSMIDHENGELYLTDTAGNPIFGMAPGTQMTLKKVRITNYRMEYLPAELKWRGNPALETGDVIFAETQEGTDAVFYVMKQTLQLSSGLSGRIICEGENETSSEFSSDGAGPSSQKTDRLYTSLQESIIRATEQITGQNGGHVVIRENSRGPAEILIMDTDDIRTAKKVWRWSQGGLGYSRSGYEGPYETAVTQDGEIIGAFLQAESIAGSKLKIDSSTIEKIVSGINAGEQKIHSAVLEIDSENLNEAIKMQVSENGGFNKISNSAGAFGTQGWIAEGEVISETGSDEKQHLICGRAFIIPAAGSLLTDTEAAPILLNTGKRYTLSLSVKQEDVQGDLLLSAGGKALAEISLGGSGGTWQKYEESFIVPETYMGEPCTLKITSVNGNLRFGDLMLTEGISSVWSACPGEVVSTDLTMSQFGITINQEHAGTKTVIDAEGTRVVSTDAGGEIIAQYTDKGVEAKTLIAEEQIVSGRVRMISMDENLMAAWIINNDTEVDL